MASRAGAGAERVRRVRHAAARSVGVRRRWRRCDAPRGAGRGVQPLRRVFSRVDGGADAQRGRVRRRAADDDARSGEHRDASARGDGRGCALVRPVVVRAAASAPRGGGAERGTPGVLGGAARDGVPKLAAAPGGARSVLRGAARADERVRSGARAVRVRRRGAERRVRSGARAAVSAAAAAADAADAADAAGGACSGTVAASRAGGPQASGEPLDARRRNG